VLRLKGLTRSIDLSQHARKLTVSLPRTLEVCPGDKVLLRRNRRSAGLINGQVLTVSGIRADGFLETKEGKLIPPDFRHFGHGYVVTSYKSQGRTHDKVVIAAEQLDSKSAYVACSRGRQEARVFTPDKAHLLARLDRSADRTAAMDIIGASRSAYWQHSRQIAQQRAARKAVFFHAALDRSRTLEMHFDR
jgi:ATP-dependent exoDNAse (exonuclease V) alpha subunit